MLTKIVSIKETSAIFLAIVLVLGTIALAVPSFSVEAQATSDREKDYDLDKKDYYEKDRDYKSRDHEEKKSYDKDDYKSEYSSYGKYDRDHDKYEKDSKSVFVKKVKCNNINVNINGVTANIGLPSNGPVTEPIAVAQEDEDDDEEIESNSIESDNDESYEGRDGKSDSDTNSRIVCINNNNNIIVEEEQEEEQDPCIACFEKFFTPELFDESFDDIVDFCQDADAGAIIDETTFRLSLEIAGVEDIDGLIECLEDEGVEFIQGPPI